METQQLSLIATLAPQSRAASTYASLLGVPISWEELSTWLVRDWEVADAEAEAEDAAEALSWLEEEALISEAALEQKQT